MITGNQSEKVMQAMLCMTRQCWEAGISAQALLECKEEKLTELMVYDIVLRQSADGRLCNVENTPAVTDSAFCIPAVYLTGKRRNIPDYVEAARKNIRFLTEKAEHAADGTLFHMIHTAEIWADSAAFLPYALALTGHHQEAFRQITGLTKRLYDPETQLYFHIWDEKKRTYARPLRWGVGNGWILTGLMRTLEVWDDSLKEEKTILEKKFLELLTALLRYETENHGFHDILNDRSTFEESETAAMIAYTIYRSVRTGFLGNEYLERADAIRERLLTKISPNGCVQDASSSPAFDRSGTSVECQAHVLMMENEHSYV